MTIFMQFAGRLKYNISIYGYLSVYKATDFFKKIRFAHDLKQKRICLVRYGTLWFPSTDAL